jgi:hypothetical protein
MQNVYGFQVWLRQEGAPMSPNNLEDGMVQESIIQRRAALGRRPLA